MKSMKIKEYLIIEDKDSMSTEEQKFIGIIKDFMCEHLEKLGVYYDGEYRIIYKAPSFDTPMFSTKEENPELQNDIIFIASKSYVYWSQVIYQLSHELTHCFIYANNKSKEQKALWIEESICEIMAYYFLKYFADNWETCSLSLYDLNYGEKIREYLHCAMNQEKTGLLSECKSYEELMKIDAFAQECRADRRKEVLQMLELLSCRDICGLLKYKDYVIQNKKILCTQRYHEDNLENRVIGYLCNLQNKILQAKIDM